MKFHKFYLIAVSFCFSAGIHLLSLSLIPNIAFKDDENRHPINDYYWMQIIIFIVLAFIFMVISCYFNIFEFSKNVRRIYLKKKALVQLEKEMEKVERDLHKGKVRGEE